MFYKLKNPVLLNGIFIYCRFLFYNKIPFYFLCKVKIKVKICKTKSVRHETVLFLWLQK